MISDPHKALWERIEKAERERDEAHSHNEAALALLQHIGIEPHGSVTRGIEDLAKRFATVRSERDVLKAELARFTSRVPCREEFMIADNWRGVCALPVGHAPPCESPLQRKTDRPFATSCTSEPEAKTDEPHVTPDCLHTVCDRDSVRTLCLVCGKTSPEAKPAVSRMPIIRDEVTPVIRRVSERLKASQDEARCAHEETTPGRCDACGCVGDVLVCDSCGDAIRTVKP